jgi:hypothetical protein
MPTPTTVRAVPAGVDLVEVLADFGPRGEAWINGTGHVEAVELRIAGDGSDPVHSLKGRLTLLQLSGPAGGPFSLILARASDVGIELLGGVLVRARSAGVSLAVHPAGVSTGRSSAAAGVAADAPAFATTLQGPAAVASRPESPALPWATAAAANARALARDAEAREEEPVPEAGDLVDHFAFGKCEVLTSDGDRLRIRDLDGPKRIREVSLAMLRVTEPTESDGKRLFRLVRKGSAV